MIKDNRKNVQPVCNVLFTLFSFALISQLVLKLSLSLSYIRYVWKLITALNEVTLSLDFWSFVSTFLKPDRQQPTR